jgi:cytochrome c oxidase subunit 2
MKLRAIVTLAVLAVLLGFFSLWIAQQSYSWMPPEAAAEAKLFDDLFSIFVGLGTFVLLDVTIPILYSLVFHRAGKYDGGQYNIRSDLDDRADSPGLGAING